MSYEENIAKMMRDASDARKSGASKRRNKNEKDWQREIDELNGRAAAEAKAKKKNKDSK